MKLFNKFGFFNIFNPLQLAGLGDKKISQLAARRWDPVDFCSVVQNNGRWWAKTTKLMDKCSYVLIIWLIYDEIYFDKLLINCW